MTFAGSGVKRKQIWQLRANNPNLNLLLSRDFFTFRGQRRRQTSTWTRYGHMVLYTPRGFAYITWPTVALSGNKYDYYAYLTST